MTIHRTTVHLTLEDSRRPLPAIQVSLYDRDGHSDDDLLGSATTDGRGEATIGYTPSDYADKGVHDEVPSNPGDVLPELFVVVRNDQGKAVFSTRSSAVADTLLRRIHVGVPRALAESAGLLKLKPRASAEQKDQDVDALLRDLGARFGVFAPCLTALALDTIAHLERPRTPVQRQAAKAVAARSDLDRRLLPQVTDLAARGLARVRASEVIDLSECPGDGDVDMKSYAAAMLELDPTLAAVKQALQVDVPAPATSLGEPQPGVGFAGTWQGWSEPKYGGCLSRYLDGTLEDTVAKLQMDQYYPSGVEIRERPRVNSIAVWDDRYGTGQLEREADVPAKRLTYRTFAVSEGDVGWHEQAVDMAVPLDHPDCLIARQDPADDPHQILAVDLVPGQQVELRGSGFTSSTATVRVHFFPWRNYPVDEAGRLQTDDDGARWVSGWDKTIVPVHGSSDPPGPTDTPTSYLKDRIVFDWPEVAHDRGLYRLTFEFDNPTNQVVDVEQDPDTCRLEFDTRVGTAELWFAVLPLVGRKRAALRASKVECIEVTHPQWWPDDISYQVTGVLQRFQLAPGGPGQLAPGNPHVMSGGRMFVNGTAWIPAPALEPMPVPGFTPPTLDPLDVIIGSLVPMEIPGVFDKAVLAVLAFVIAIVLLVLLAALLAALLALLGVPGAGWIALFGLLVKALLGASLIIALQEPLLQILVAPLSIHVIGRAGFAIHGDEYNHLLSPVRFHRMLWTQQRPSQLPGTTVLETVVVGGAFRETYRCRRFGGEYHLECTLTP